MRELYRNREGYYNIIDSDFTIRIKDHPKAWKNDYDRNQACYSFVISENYYSQLSSDEYLIRINNDYTEEMIREEIEDILYRKYSIVFDENLQEFIQK